MAACRAGFVALLHDASPTPLDALTGSRGWIDPAGTLIADLPSDWLDGSDDAPAAPRRARTLLGAVNAWIGFKTAATCATTGRRRTSRCAVAC